MKDIKQEEQICKRCRIGYTGITVLNKDGFCFPCETELRKKEFDLSLRSQELQGLYEEIEGKLRNRELANNFAGNPNEWQISILNYNRALQDVLQTIKERMK